MAAITKPTRPLWRKDRVELGDGVIGGVWDLEEAFRTDPYIVSFKRGNFDFALVFLHTRWSNDPEGTSFERSADGGRADQLVEVVPEGKGSRPRRGEYHRLQSRHSGEKSR